MTMRLGPQIAFPFFLFPTGSWRERVGHFMCENNIYVSYGQLERDTEGERERDTIRLLLNFTHRFERLHFHTIEKTSRWIKEEKDNERHQGCITDQRFLDLFLSQRQEQMLRC